jgi:Family of unknown function (DUF6516)
MRRALIEGYFQATSNVLAAFPFVSTSDVTFDKRSSTIGFLCGDIYFSDGSLLHFRELLNLRSAGVCNRYVDQYQRSVGSLVFRYDNTSPFPDLLNHPQHKYDGDKITVVPAEQPTLAMIIEEIGSSLSE